MFDEDNLDIDFDEILNCSQFSVSSVKRPVQEELPDDRTKRQKQTATTISLNQVNSPGCSKETKKVFNFTKTPSKLNRKPIPYQSPNDSSENLGTAIESSCSPLLQKKSLSQSGSDPTTSTNTFKRLSSPFKTNGKNGLLQNQSLSDCSKKLFTPIESSKSWNDTYNSGISSPLMNKNSLIRSGSDPTTSTKYSEKLNTPYKTNGMKSISPNESKMRRKFPGPAGLLPEVNADFSNIERRNLSHTDPKEVICSQSSDLLFTDGPWEQMRNDYLPKSPEEIYLPNKYNISWIKSRGLMKKLINQKAPFLAAYIAKISSHSIQNPIVNILLKDESGTINGTVLHNLYEEYATYLIVGSVIILKEIGVLNTGSNEPYLTITPNNLIAIYTSNCKNGSTGFSQNTDGNKIIMIQNITVRQILSNIRELKIMYDKENERKNQSLSKTPRTINEHIDVCNNFKKTVHNMRVQKPNLTNLKAKPLSRVDSVATSHPTKAAVNISAINKYDDKIEDLMDIFKTKEGIDEFFEEEPKFCSTQKIPNDTDKVSPILVVEKEQIWENVFEGVDANSLFDDF